MTTATPSDEDDGGRFQGPLCAWTNVLARPDNTYTGGAILNNGADYAVGLEPLRAVDGFAATTTTAIATDPTYYCQMLVDVAPGQALSAVYTNNAQDYPGMNHQLACDKAQQLASFMLGTLREMKQR